MDIIGILDTRVSDNNLGNHIIMKSVYKFLDETFPSDYIMMFPFADDFGRNTLAYMKECKYIFIGGTNSLSSEMNKYKQIGLNLRNSKMLESKFVLLGLGWWQYQERVNEYTRKILKSALCKNVMHSVRDNYSLNRLYEAGINNALNTGCPSLWGMDIEHCDRITKKKSDAEGGNVLVCYTDYNRNKKRDEYIMQVLKKNYANIYAWVQGPADYEYVLSMNHNVNIIPPRVRQLEKILDETEMDYVGTRLHAGIFCMQKYKRSIIIGIDNRAVEMKKDFNIPVVEERDIYNRLDEMINNTFETRIVLPEKNIKQWKCQF